MNLISPQIQTSAFLFLLTILSGIWVSRKGRPLKTGIFTLHKLIALAAAALFVVSIYNWVQTMNLQGIVFTSLILCAVFLVGLLVTGGLLSFEKPTPTIILRLHQIFPVLVFLSAGSFLYLVTSL